MGLDASPGGVREEMCSHFINYIRVIQYRLGRTVCVVWVDDSPDPVYFEDDDGEKFYARSGSSSEPLGIQDANQYILQNWS